MSKPLTTKEILSNYKIYKSPKQQEALQTNHYLKGFGEAIEESLFNLSVFNLEEKKQNKDYIEGRLDSLFSISKLDENYTMEEIKALFIDIGRVSY